MTNDQTLDGGDKPVIEAEVKPEAAVEAEKAAAEAVSEIPASPDKTEDETRKAKAEKTRDRIQDLSRKAREAEARAVAAEKRIAELTAARPKEGDFSDPVEYDRAMLRHAVREGRVDELKVEREGVAKEAEAAKAEIWQARVAVAIEAMPDFAEVAYKAPITDAVASIVADSEKGPEIAYFLGKNPDEAKRISSLSPLAAAREIGRLEAEMTPKPRKISNAPPPVDTVGGGASSGNMDPAKMSIEQLRKHIGIGAR